MKLAEIKNALKQGEKVYVTNHMIFKYGKLKRESTTTWKVGEQSITERQFDAIRGYLGVNQGSLDSKFYTLIDWSI